ncbi:MAG: hypothetical protein ACI935_001200 [Moritella dasanensis]|jgi:hypothetical protein
MLHIKIDQTNATHQTFVKKLIFVYDKNLKLCTFIHCFSDLNPITNTIPAIFFGEIQGFIGTGNSAFMLAALCD